MIKNSSHFDEILSTDADQGLSILIFACYGVIEMSNAM